MSYTPFGRLILEALVVAISFLVLFFVVRVAAKSVLRLKGGENSNVALAGEVAVAAGLFHIVCEYTGLNKWYCDHRN